MGSFTLGLLQRSASPSPLFVIITGFFQKRLFHGSLVCRRTVFMEPSAYPWQRPPSDRPYEEGNRRPRSKSWRHSAYLKVFFILISRRKGNGFEPKGSIKNDR